MLVFASDLHLTDGSSGKTIEAGAFRILRKQLGNLAYAASYRTDGGYRPVEQVHLVLLGDVLDVIRSSQWLAAGTFIRPWSDVKDPAFAERVGAITDAIVAHNAESLGVLKSISSGRVRIPRKAGAHRTLDATEEAEIADWVPVKVNTYYMVGNHDWFYHLPGTAANRVREKLVGAMGLANDPNSPFPHDLDEAPALARVCRDHAVCARHGDRFDPFNCEPDRDGSSLGDVIVVTLLNRFPDDAAQRLGGELPQACLDGLRDIDNVRPVLMIPVWVDGLLKRTCSDPGQIQKVKNVWDELADDFLAEPFVRDRDLPWNPFDNVDKLALALKFSKGVSISGLGQLATWLQGKLGGAAESYGEHALAERPFKKRTARFVVYGHTHRHEIVPLEFSYQAHVPLSQFYINTGTWRRVYEVTKGRPGAQEFLGYNVMTYATFFQGDERRG